LAYGLYACLRVFGSSLKCTMFCDSCLASCGSRSTSHGLSAYHG
jgi:hypothetical protein